MDERAIKRLLIIFAASIIAIVIIKTVLSKTIISLNKAATEKKQAALSPPAVQQTATPASDTAITMEIPAASAVVEVTTLEPSAASGVSEAR